MQLITPPNSSQPEPPHQAAATAPAAAEPKVPHEATISLGAAIAAVPQLGEACISILTDTRPGSGLKVMRLVCKELQAAMLGVVRGYTLCLDGRADGLADQMKFLKSTSLTHLRISIITDCGGERFSCQRGFSPSREFDC